MFRNKLMRWQPLQRRASASARLVRLMLASRFLDEWWGGLIMVLLPVIRDDLGLTYGQVSVLLASFGWAGWAADPMAGLIGDVWPRRPVIAWSAVGVALVMGMLSAAGSFEALLLVCVGYALGVTPLAVIADATLIDAHPGAPGRIMARQTFIDTLGALLAPLSATILAAVGVPWPTAFLVGGGVFLAYGLALWRTPFPPNGPATRGESDAGDGPGGLRAAWRMMRHNLKTVSRLPGVWRWLFFITLSDFLSDVALGFLPLFLADEVGLGEAATGLYLLANMIMHLVGLAALEPLLAHWGERRILTIATMGVGLLFPLWALNRDPLLSFLLLLPLAALTSTFWPLGKARLMAAAEERTATVTALGPLAGLPANVAPLIVGAVAGVAGLRAGMLILAVAPPIMVLVMRGAWAKRQGTPGIHGP